MPDAVIPRLTEEVELKFTVPASQTEVVQQRLPCAKPGAGHKAARKRLRSVYYDTPDLALRRRGISLRVRHVDGRRLQTVKCDGAGPAGRLECEHEIAGDHPDLTCVAEAGLQDLFSDIDAPARLRPVFATEIDRTAWQFDHKGASIECALDVGEIRAGG
jgi:triphosphatase